MQRQLAPACRRIMAVVGWAWALYIIYTALAIARHPVVQGASFFALGTIFAFTYYPMTKAGATKHWPGLLDILVIIAAIFISGRAVLNYEVFTRQYYIFTSVDVVLSVIALAIALEGTRRTFGWALPVLVLFFFSYLIWGKYIPGVWGHPGFDLAPVLARMYRGTDGYWGTVTWVMSTIVAIFILLGPVLVASGATKVIMGIANRAAGRMPGGAAQISAVGSCLFGTISGSAVANVVAVGVITIPTMKKVGYSSSFAGAVEATASTGGQIMPPIMGAGAFVMAEFLGVPYMSIAWAALVPALLYYFALMSILFFHARVKKIGSLPPELIPKASEIFAPRTLGAFVIPVAVLLGLLFYTFIPQFAAAGAILTAVLLYLATGGPASLGEAHKRLAIVGEGFVSGVQSIAGLALLSVSIQVAIFCISFTGVGVKLSELIIGVGKGSLILALLLSMGATIVLGMGMATTAAYVIAIAVVEAPLVKLGLPPLSAHMFVFYFAIIGAISPPVCPACFAASAIARTGWGRLSIIAMGLGLTGFVVPFIFVYQPALLMQGSVQQILLSSLTAAAGVFVLAGAALGCFLNRATIPERIVLAIGGALLVVSSSPIWNAIGLAAVLVVSLVQWLRAARESRLEATGSK